MLERSNAKRPPKVATEAVAEEDEGHVAAVATATATATAAAAAATKGNGNALSAVPRITLHVTVPNQDNRL